MNIKSSQKLVEEAKKVIESINSDEVKKLNENGKITLIDIRDIRELWRERYYRKFETYSERYA